jgi:hypothetical protein
VEFLPACCAPALSGSIVAKPSDNCKIWSSHGQRFLTLLPSHRTCLACRNSPVARKVAMTRRGDPIDNGDRVRIILAGPHEGTIGTVTSTAEGEHGPRYQVRFDQPRDGRRSASFSAGHLERTQQKSISTYSGQRGVWAAVVTYTDGIKEKLGCIHEDHLVSEGGKQFYQTTFLEDEQSKAKTLINLLREKRRAIVTESARDADGSLILPRNRIAYTGVVSIGDVSASGDPPSLRFQITGRYAQGQKNVQP